MKRTIVRIDEKLCNGCGRCVPGCAEGAIRISGGKARLAAENLCDGLGACLGGCPQGAITIEERDADAFDGRAVQENREGLRPLTAPAAHDDRPGEDHRGHPGSRDHRHGGIACPSAIACPIERPAAGGARSAGEAASELTHWPVKLHLVPPNASFFQGRELVVAADCAPVACADFHRRFLKGNAVVIQCPKFGEPEIVLEKLAAIISRGGITGVMVVRMEVPCCGELNLAVGEAVRVSGRNSLPVSEAVVGARGDIVSERTRGRGQAAGEVQAVPGPAGNG